MRREQAATDPTNLRWRDDLASALTHLGTTLESSGDHAAALAALQEALAVRESIAATMPELSANNPALANLYLTLAHTAGPHTGEACDWLLKAQRAFAQMRQRAGLTGAAVDEPPPRTAKHPAAADRPSPRATHLIPKGHDLRLKGHDLNPKVITLIPKGHHLMNKGDDLVKPKGHHLDTERS